MSVISTSKEFLAFRRNVSLQRRTVDNGEGNRVWRFYDYGPKTIKCPIVMFPQVGGTAETFFRQIMGLGALGYRVIAVDYAPYATYKGFVDGFTKLLDTLGLDKVHIFGTAFGGFLAQMYAKNRPRRVESLILCNSYCDSTSFSVNVPLFGMFNMAPEFMLKRILLSNFPQGDLPPHIADSVDFVVEQLETMDHASLSSRLTLNAQGAAITAPAIEGPNRVTIIETNDECAISPALRDSLRETYKEARVVELKTGGNFPHLAVSDEINMYIKLHCRPFLDTPSSPQYVESATGEATASA